MEGEEEEDLVIQNEAACLIQSLFRVAAACRVAGDLLCEKYDRIWVEEKQKSYFVDRATKTATWTIPYGARGISRLQEAEKRAANQLWKEHFDAESLKYYYVHVRTGKSQWDVPAGFETEREKKIKALKFKKPRRLSQTDPTNDAAMRIQRLFHRMRNRQGIIQLLQSCYEKIWNPEAKEYFYFNKVTGKSSWTKPLLLGSRDLPPSVPKPDDQPAEEKSETAAASQGAVPTAEALTDLYDKWHKEERKEATLVPLELPSPAIEALRRLSKEPSDFQKRLLLARLALRLKHCHAIGKRRKEALLAAEALEQVRAVAISLSPRNDRDRLRNWVFPGPLFGGAWKR